MPNFFRRGERESDPEDDDTQGKFRLPSPFKRKKDEPDEEEVPSKGKFKSRELIDPITMYDINKASNTIADNILKDHPEGFKKLVPDGITFDELRTKIAQYLKRFYYNGHENAIADFMTNLLHDEKFRRNFIEVLELQEHRS